MLALDENPGNFGSGDGIWAFQVRDGAVSELATQFDFSVQDSGGATDTASVVIHSVEGTAIQGGPDDDILIGGVSDDEMTGAGGSDVFVFSEGGGADTVKDYADGSDLVDLHDFAGLNSIGDLTISQQGAHAYIDLGGGDSITLENLSVAALDNSDFLF